MTRRLLAVVSLSLSLVACGEEPPAPLPDSGVVPTGDAGLPPAPDAGMVPEGQAVLSARSVDFGNVVVGTSATATLTLTNPSAFPARVRVSPPVGRDEARFRRTLSLPDEGGAFTLPAGQSAVIQVEVVAEAAGILSASLAVSTCAEGCVDAVSLLALAVDDGLVCSDRLELGLTKLGRCTTRSATCANEANVAVEVRGLGFAPGSAPAFRLPAPPALPRSVAPGESLALAVDFCPAAAGDALGRLEVTTRGASRVVTLSGHGGGADLRCTPAALSFGLVGVGVPVEGRVRCVNEGPEAGEILAAQVSGADFSLVGGPGRLEPGAALELTVTVRATLAGAVLGELVLDTTDVERPRLLVPLSAEALALGACQASLSPDPLELGLVSLGRQVRAGLRLTNHGSEQCLISGAALAGAGFTLASAPPAGALLAGGETVALEVLFGPSAAGTSSASLSVAFANPGSAPALALILGTGGTPLLRLQPDPLDFGAVPVGCAAPATRRVTVQNLGAAPLAVDGLRLVGTTTTAFSVGAALPLVLGPLATAAVDLSFTPPAEGAYVLQLLADVAGRPGAAAALILGTGTAGAPRQDRFPPPGPLDILVVVDDSASMGPAQAALGAALPALATELAAAGVDFHLAFVTTDMAAADRQGRFYGGPAVLDATAVDLAAEVGRRAQPGVAGSGTERGVDAAVAALTPPLVDNENAGFLRAGAHLWVLIVSDEDDFSTGSPEQAVTALSGAAGGALSIFLLTGPANGGCTGPEGSATQARRYHELLARAPSGGSALLCQPLAAGLDALADQAFRRQRLPLSAAALPGTVRVAVGGVVLTPGSGAYSEEPWAQSVLLADRPPAAAEVVVDYLGFCLSPACGDGSPDPFEQCDDGNQDDTDGCVAGCRLASCGDGLVAAGAEACDDANAVPTDACLPGCAAASCGDGFLWAGVEDCEDSNTVSGDGCPATCAFERSVAAYYTVANLAAAPFTALAAPAPVVFVGGEDDGLGQVPIPFTFSYFGVQTASVATVSPNGWLSFVPTTELGAANLTFPLPGAPDGLVAPWWEDLVIDRGVPGGADVAYEVLGQVGDRALVIEWRGLRLANQSTANHRRFTFQVALFEATGAIELRYGETATSGAVPSATSASAGLENLDGTAGQATLACTPNCAGPARPANPNGFPRQSVVRLTPL